MNKNWKITIGSHPLGGVCVRTLALAGDQFVKKLAEAIESAVQDIVRQQRERAQRC